MKLVTSGRPGAEQGAIIAAGRRDIAVVGVAATKDLPTIQSRFNLTLQAGGSKREEIVDRNATADATLTFSTDGVLAGDARAAILAAGKHGRAVLAVTIRTGFGSEDGDVEAEVEVVRRWLACYDPATLFISGDRSVPFAAKVAEFMEKVWE